MKNIVVFYNNQVLEELDENDLPHASLAPDSSYAYVAYKKAWYFHRWGGWLPINTVDVPATLKMWLLVL